MDGLLVDTEKYMWEKNGKIVFKEMGFVFDEDVYRSTMGRNVIAALPILEKHYGPKFNGKEYYNRVKELNLIQIKNRDIPVMKGVFELLEFLKKNKIKVAVGTSTHKDLAYGMLEAIGVSKYTDKIICGDDVTRSKPEPDIYLKVVEEFKTIKKEEAFVFEDAHSGIRAAINANIPVIIVPNVATFTKDDEKEAFAVIESLDKAIDIIKKLNNIN